jgi:phosphoribosylamine--glycine ligase/phosphoribosylformylglycinamidine cyclo-ligase
MQAQKQGLSTISNLTGTTGDYTDLARRAKSLGVGLVVVGSDEDVVNGIEGVFRDGKSVVRHMVCFSVDLDSDKDELIVDIPCFAPSPEAAELEGSKIFAKEFMARNGIPTAQHRSFENFPEATSHVRHIDHRIVIKADGLAAGKGVILPETQEEALQALQTIMSDGKPQRRGT